MPSSTTDWFARYQAVRRRAEIGFWVAVLMLQASLNSVVAWFDLRHQARPVAPWEPVLWEFSSNLALLVLIPALLAFERRFPLRWAHWRRSLPAHLAGSVLFSLAHVALMVALRHAGYAAAGAAYAFGDWPREWLYEYLKDGRTYALLLAAVLSYRWFLLRLQGEARLLDAPDEPVLHPPQPVEAEPAEAPDAAADAAHAASGPAAGASTASATGAAGPATARPERFLVRKLRREFLIAAGDIEWLQAQGNYVALRVRGHDYLLRSTLADFLGQLDPARFARVHRSYAVNLDQVAEIEPLEAGDARLLMRDGARLPCSRRWRGALAGR